MMNSDNRLFCRLDGLPAAVREQQRVAIMHQMGLLESESPAVFEEATQTAAHCLETAICILALMEPEQQRFKSAVGLSRLGTMNELATSRQLARSESFCAHVVDSQQVLIIRDTLEHPAFANSLLVHQHGIRAYLGVPLLTSEGHCIGTLAVMDLMPHEFTAKDMEFLALTARWSMSEFERQQVSKRQSFGSPAPSAVNADAPAIGGAIANKLQIDLLSQLAQELRTPLTAVMGMASVLHREIYGPLTTKQKEYLDIIHQSGQYLLSLVNEILELSELKDNFDTFIPTSVDIEMLCQQAIGTLEQAANRREQQIRLSVEPGCRIWLLDKNKIRQMLYHLIFSVIQSSTAGSIVRLHVSHRKTGLSIAIWVSHPWLGEGLPQSDVHSQPSLVSAGVASLDLESQNFYEVEFEPDSSGYFDLSTEFEARSSPAPACNTLGLLLCQQIAKMHGGEVTVQALSETGYRYVISLPQSANPNQTAQY